MPDLKARFKKEYGFMFFMLLSLLLAFYKIVIHLKYIPLPLFFFALGLISYRLNPKKSLYLFLFLLPLVNAAPDFFSKGHPFNYIGITLFYLSGMAIAALTAAILRKEKAASFDFKWARPYLLFLAILWISAFFLLLRWSNLTLSRLAFFKDTPVTPSGELVSFATIFPVAALFLFSTTPYILALIKKNRLEETRVFKMLLGGYSLSFAVGLYQKFVDPDFMAIRWWGEKLEQYNGGFSDFNAFGFFSGALFLYQVIALLNYVKTIAPGKTGKKTLNLDFILLVFGLLVTLAGIFLSGCRTAFIFILFAAVYLLFSRRIKLRYKLVSLTLVAILVIIAGGTLKKRILDMTANIKQIHGSTDIITALDKVTNGRIEMMQRSIPIITKYPITGIGNGNFLFFLKYRFMEEKYWEDLPLNQYLLILDETGLIGLFVFICFLAALLKQKRKKIYLILLISCLTAIFFNFFFWFPEVLLLFWIISSFAEDKTTERNKVAARYKSILAGILVFIFVLFNIIHFASLHPKTWIKEKGKYYSYGLWYQEKSPANEIYRWSKRQAGVYLYLDEKGESKRFKLYCGAPLDKLAEKKQEVKIFWKGKFYKKIVFRENKDFQFKVKDKSLTEGFLELRVTPTFNLRKMKISAEPRNLGVQFYTLLY